jgi:ATP citrate (pro-S)-lyase
VIGNLWLKKDLPDYGLEFINTILILLADHGPAVSGANNAIVTARAGNDLKSSLIAGLTTI